MEGEEAIIFAVCYAWGLRVTLLQPGQGETLKEFKYRHNSKSLFSGVDVLLLYNGTNHYFTARKYDKVFYKTISTIVAYEKVLLNAILYCSESGRKICKKKISACDRPRHYGWGRVGRHHC